MVFCPLCNKHLETACEHARQEHLIQCAICTRLCSSILINCDWCGSVLRRIKESSQARMTTTMHQVDSPELLAAPGDYVFMGDDWLVLVCPLCKKPGVMPQSTIMQRDPLTMADQFLCKARPDDKFCGWRGSILEGVLSGP